MQNEEKSDTPKEKACSKSYRHILNDVVFFVHFGGLAILRFRIETSTRLKSRDSSTCKQALEEDSGFTAAGEPLQVYPRETDGQSFRHGLVHGFA